MMNSMYNFRSTEVVDNFFVEIRRPDLILLKEVPVNRNYSVTVVRMLGV